jgi:hypothetical protein
MTDAEMLTRLLAQFYVADGRLFYGYREDVNVGEMDPELEPHLIARFSAAPGAQPDPLRRP